jgi:hypothetical protein
MAALQRRRREKVMADDGWRHNAAYLYIHGIPNSCRTWEFTRRNAGYCDDHRAAVTST